MYTIAISLRTTIINQKTQYICNKSYIDMLYKYDCTPIFFSDASQVEKMIEQIDALLLPGGLDIHPKLYHQIKESQTTCDINEIDVLDMQLIDIFYSYKKPILGICRGIQSLNVYFNGTLKQHINNHMQNENKNIPTHFIFPHQNSFLKVKIKVNSFHHQSIDQVAPIFNIISYSEDHEVEMIEYQNIIGVQWHPELLDYDLIFPHFLVFLKKETNHLQNNNTIINKEIPIP